MLRNLLLLGTALIFFAHGVRAGELISDVRYKLSAGDLSSGMALVEDYQRAHGTDAEYLGAIGWLARGSAMLQRYDLADRYLDQLHNAIPTENDELLLPFGAAIEVQAKLIAHREGRGAAIRFLDTALAKAKDQALRSRISKNIDLLSLEGEIAPPLDATNFVGTTAPPTLASLRGRPVLLFFWAWWCSDCKAQSSTLTRVWQKYRSQGLAIVTGTRTYGNVDDKPATPAEEKVQIEKVWKETYQGLKGVGAVISTDTMVRYGVSATPTMALIDRKGIVRLYTPTRMSEAELSRRVEELLAEPE